MEKMSLSGALLMLLLPIFIFVSSCGNDDDGQESSKSITTVVLILEDDEQQVALFTARNLDGNPEIDPITLAPNKRYEIGLSFLEENGENVVVYTQTIQTQNLDHLVCFATSDDIPTPIILDKDDMNGPLGLESEWITAGPGTGTLTITLLFMPDKSNNAPCNAGITDVTLTLEVIIEG